MSIHQTFFNVEKFEIEPIREIYRKEVGTYFTSAIKITCLVHNPEYTETNETFTVNIDLFADTKETLKFKILEKITN